MTVRLKRVFVCAAAALFVSAATGGAAELVERLPKKAAVYAKVDMGAMLNEGGKWMKFLDAESGGTIEVQTKEIHKNLKEVLAAQFELKAKLFDSLDSLKLHFVLIAKKEPITKTHTYKVPAFDPETFQRIPGKFEERSYTTTDTYDFALVGETAPEVAEDFMTQFKALMERMKEKDPESKEYTYKKVEVEKGELLSNPDSFGSLGRLDGLIIFSKDISKDFWNMFCSTPTDSMANEDVHKRLKAEAAKPIGCVLVNIEEIVNTHEKSLIKALEEARKAAEAASADPKKPGQEQWKLLRAQSSLGSFQLWKNALGLGNLRVAGANMFMDVKEKTANSGMNMMLQIKEPMPAVLKLVLDAGRKLEVPGVVKPDAMCYMLRLGLDKMLFTVMTAIGEDKAQAITQQLLMIKSEMGIDLPTLLAHLAGDVYVFFDFAKKEISTMVFETVEGSDQPKMVPKKVERTMPEFLVLLGLKDRKAFNELLSSTFAAASASPKGAPWVKKRTYQETDVYLVGAKVSEEGADPDGMTSFAMVVVDRHLSFGSWKDVTALIRKAKAAKTEEGKALAELVSKREGANLILAVPKKFIKKMQNLSKEAGTEPGAAEVGGDPFDMMIKMLETAPLPIEDETLNKKVKEGLQAWLKAFKTLSEKAQDSGPDMSDAYGRLNSGFYEVKSAQEIRKAE